MRTNRIGLALVAAVMTLAPLVAAQTDQGTETSERPDDAAWVEDCPPDMMCAAGDAPVDNSTDGAIGFGPDGCIECSGPAPGQGIWEQDCPPDVQCMGDGAPQDDGGVGVPQDEAAVAETSSGLGGASVVFGTAAALLAFVALRRRA